MDELHFGSFDNNVIKNRSRCGPGVVQAGSTGQKDKRMFTSFINSFVGADPRQIAQQNSSMPRAIMTSPA